MRNRFALATNRTPPFLEQVKNCLARETAVWYQFPMAAITPQRNISLLIKAKRRKTGLGVREAADECGISAATMSRLERGGNPQLPDASTLTKLANWLRVSVADLLKHKESGVHAPEPEENMPEFVEVHLRADKNLSPETADALAKMFRQLYDNVANKPMG